MEREEGSIASRPVRQFRSGAGSRRSGRGEGRRLGCGYLWGGSCVRCCGGLGRLCRQRRGGGGKSSRGELKEERDSCVFSLPHFLFFEQRLTSPPTAQRSHASSASVKYTNFPSRSRAHSRTGDVLNRLLDGAPPSSLPSSSSLVDADRRAEALTWRRRNRLMLIPSLVLLGVVIGLGAWGGEREG